MDIDILREIIINLWKTKNTNTETSNYKNDPDQNIVIVLLINDLLGGSINRCLYKNKCYYYNSIDGRIMDFTITYDTSVYPNYDYFEVVCREYLLRNTDIRKKYLSFKDAVLNRIELINEQNIKSLNLKKKKKKKFAI